MGLFESQLKTRERLDAELTERAYAELAASVSPAGSAPRITADDMEQADAAVKVCLKYLGVQPGEIPETAVGLYERMDWLCRPSGTMRRKVSLESDWYRSAFGIMLGTLDTGETVALVPRGMGGYYYLDHETGHAVRINANNAKKIKSEALLFYKPLPARSLSRADLLGFAARIIDRTDYILIFAAALAAALVGLVPAIANHIAFDIVVPSGQAGLIVPIGLFLLGAAVSSALIGLFRDLITARVENKLSVMSQAAFFSRVLSLPASFFKTYSSGDLASRVNAVPLFFRMAASSLLGSGLSVILTLVYVVQIGGYARALVIPSLLIFIIQIVLIAVTTVMGAHQQSAARKASSSLSGTETALLGGVQKIKLAGAEDRAFAKWAHKYSEYARYTYNLPFLVKTLPALIVLTGLLGSVLIYYIAGTRGIGVSDYMAFSVAYGQITAAASVLASSIEQITRIAPILDLIQPILDAYPETASAKPGVKKLSGDIEVSAVSFRYDEKSPYIVKDLSFKVKPGEYVAIVGKSGCGKTTITRLLLGMEIPESGSIFYGPYDVNSVDLKSLRRHIGVVTQDGKLFTGDILNNIIIAAPGATVQDAWEAAEIAGIADDIRALPMGMHTYISEGSGGISGGQKQRLMIARAVCGKPKILIFDEATSALDNITQKQVTDALKELKCTRLVIAHRLSTVKHCDRILVVDRGNIVEEGTYEELMSRDGSFAELARRQLLEEE